VITKSKTSPNARQEVQKNPKKTLTKSVLLSLPSGTLKGKLPGQEALAHCSSPPNLT
jgi:hypothetical protein